MALGLGSTGFALGQDSLYIGDGSDGSVKRFNAVTGAYLGAYVPPNTNLKLRGPMGLLFDNENLLVSNQNVDTSVTGEIFQYSLVNGQLQQTVIVKRNTPTSPAVPRGIVLWKDAFFVAEMISEPQKNATTPGRLLKYTRGGQLIGAFVPPAGTFTSGAEFHPRGVVIGPDGLLYVSNYDHLDTGLGGHVLRFNPNTGQFIDVFINSVGGGACSCTNELNRPEGLVFGPDGKLYITSFRADSSDTDKILIFQGPNGRNPGAYVDRIDLDVVGQPRAYAQALLFGPNGYLFVPITANGPDTGSVRRYDLTTKQYSNFVAPYAIGGPLQSGWYLTFGKTDPHTLTYP
ncbi:hypothetical protein E4O92_23735 [Massilia horti]|uniref:Gluconolactonase n=2 Tax=Massilia horti TaxID=2562153 RepID=A0A4Y9SLI2_9BURK|nr:hypothetical protein E4O92_23735 [Massilia horti]